MHRSQLLTVCPNEINIGHCHLFKELSGLTEPIHDLEQVLQMVDAAEPDSLTPQAVLFYQACLMDEKSDQNTSSRCVLDLDMLLTNNEQCAIRAMFILDKLLDLGS